MLQTESFRLQDQYCHLYNGQFIFSTAATIDTVPDTIKQPASNLKKAIYGVLILLLVVVSGFGFTRQLYYPAGIALASALVPLLRLIRMLQQQQFTVIPFSWVSEVELHRNFPRGVMQLILRFTPPGESRSYCSYTLAGPLKDGNPELEKAHALLAENFLFLKVT